MKAQSIGSNSCWMSVERKENLAIALLFLCLGMGVGNAGFEPKICPITNNGTGKNHLLIAVQITGVFICIFALC